MFRKQFQELCGAVLIGIALFFFVSIFGYNSADYTSLMNNIQPANYTGPVGAWLGHIIRSVFGLASYGTAFLLAITGLFLVSSDWVKKVTEKSVLTLILTICSAALLSMFIDDTPQLSGGYTGSFISGLLVSLFGRTASYILLSGAVLLNAVVLFILLLGPRREKLDVPSRISQLLKKLFKQTSEENEIPLIPEIGKDKKKTRASFPWIVKKQILVIETEKTGISMDSFRLPELADDTDGLNYGTIPGSAADEPMQLEMDRAIYPDNAGDGAVVLEESDYSVNVETTINPESADVVDAYDDIEDKHAHANTSDDVFMKDDAAAVENPDNDDYDEFPQPQERQSPSRSENLANVTEKVFGEIPINEDYIIPTTYLSSSKPLDTESWKNEIRRNSILLKNTLAEFGIEADVVNVNRGPVITLYEMQIAPGIKVNRVVGLADDIAMALAAQRVRIVAPIPGKSAIGVEIPNLYRETVTVGDIVKSVEFQKYEGSLVVALGKDILGKPVMVDLKRLPHLLIAGTTGAGKSVCVNSIITSLLYNYDPNYLRFILIDPKMVELQLYNGLPHLLTPVIVDPQVAPMVLKWTMHEMERRYCLLSEMSTRDIERYNEKIKRQKTGAEKLPYIVVIIDEMADLMMTSKEVEGYITRIAQKSRAVGIHLVVATQRPSVDIITGLIKANFPSRVAFQVAQKTDSRTIIDQNGAEKLLGRGDMLYQPPSSSFPIRVQGGFISEEEIEKIVAHLCKFGKPSYIDIEESLMEKEVEELDEAKDELFQEALKIIEETKKASASYLQRRLSIGYNRAARIIELMEDMGYIGPQIGSKPREVFI